MMGSSRRRSARRRSSAVPASPGSIRRPCPSSTRSSVLNQHVLDALLDEARDDENVVGLIVFGSRGKGALVREASDWDVFVVVNEHRGDRPFVHGAELETVEVTLEQLRNQPAWNRYSLTWLEPQLDKTGEVATALRDAVRVDPQSAAEPLDAYVNML